MANTEGLPDDFVESLMTIPATTTSKKKTASTTTTNNNNNNNNNNMAMTRQERLQQRLEMPMGERPAAKVVRLGGPPQQRPMVQKKKKHQQGGTPINTRHTQLLRQQQQQQQKNKPESDDEEILMDDETPTQEQQQQQPPTPTILGNIVERRQVPTTTAATRSKHNAGSKPKSRFAMAQQQQPNQQRGFPSVHMPMGTFVSKTKQKKMQQQHQQQVKVSQHVVTKNIQSPTNNIPLNTSEESIQDASARDAHNLLAQMTTDEIIQHQQDLTSAFSPQMLQFLKQRGKNSNNNNNKSSNTTAMTTTTTTTTTNQPSRQDKSGTTTTVQTTIPQPTEETTTTDKNDSDDSKKIAGTPTTTVQISMEQQERQEKERLAKIVSSVTSHQDLDAAYQAEMKQSHPLSLVEQQQKDGNTSNDGDDQHQVPNDNNNINNNNNDFALACDLLRSTSSRQTLWGARVVSQQLQTYVEQQKQQKQNTGETKMKRDWPLVLPVSLRCLLDQPTSAGFVLHTYVLQSLHCLLVLLAHPDHVVTTTTTTTTTHDDVDATRIYQECFLEDSVPTPRLDLAYSAMNTSNFQPITTGGGATAAAAAYTTSPSLASAQKDGQAFETDPMWTLLSTMRILPRLAHLLIKVDDQNYLPREAWIASCGILAMMSQRSPGAASAIAHHETLLSNLLDHTLIRPLQQEQQQDDQGGELLLAGLAAMKLLCTLARQSRVTAGLLPLETILPPLLARTATHGVEHQVQQLGLELWRTVLRYGHGLVAFSTMNSYAASHLALSPLQKYSLSVEYITALAQVLELVKVLRSKTTTPDNNNNNNNNNNLIPKEAWEILPMATTYLSSTQRQLLSNTTSNAIPLTEESKSNVQMFRWHAARLQFLSKFWTLSSESPLTSNRVTPEDEEFKTEQWWSTEQVLKCLEDLDVMLDAGSHVEKAFGVVVSSGMSQTEQNNNVDYRLEASACTFLESFSSILLTIEKSTEIMQGNNRMVREFSKSVVTRFQEHVMEMLKQSFSQGTSSTTTTILSHCSAPYYSIGVGQTKAMIPLARIGWINKCHFAIAKFLFHSMYLGNLSSSKDVHLLRTFVFLLLGRLERGSEAMAAILFSQDSLLEPSSNPLDGDISSSSGSGSSALSSLFLGELCGSDRARKQLDHSFKLQHGYGITSDGYGAFMLQSLLSNYDVPGDTSDLLLPIGQEWLWQTLSGPIRMKQMDAVQKGTEEATKVVAGALGLVLELEEGENLYNDDDNACWGYASRISVGTKLYYLMNVCLLPESVLRDDKVIDTAEAVLDYYWRKVDPTTVVPFVQSCLKHTEPPKPKKDNTNNDDDENLEENEKKLLQVLIPDNKNGGVSSFSTQEVKALEAFVDDLTESFNDYGAQYDFFTRCIRIFLSPAFPPTITCRLLRDLGVGALHLLTLPTELGDKNEMKLLLRTAIRGGLPEKDQSTRDVPEVLDAAANILLQSTKTDRPLVGHILNYTIALLVRNLGICLSSGRGLDASKRRLVQLDPNMSHLICDSALDFLEQGGTAEALMDATIQRTSTEDGMLNNPVGVNERLDNLRKELDDRNINSS